MLKRIGKLGKYAIYKINVVGLWGIFTLKTIQGIFRPPFRFQFILKEISNIGFDSLSIISFTGLFNGMVLGLQGYHTLKNFGSEGILGSGVVYMLLSELGPVLSGLLLTGRAGSALSAELGVMRISEQIDALKCMSIDIYNYLISPKLVAGIISLPLLVFIFCFSGIIGGYISGCVILGVNPGSYFNNMESAVNFALIRMCLIKSVTFVFLIITISSFQGYTVYRKKEKGALGISKATTDAVITSSVSILIADYLLTSILL